MIVQLIVLLAMVAFPRLATIRRSDFAVSRSDTTKGNPDARQNHDPERTQS
jgi:hypothetical protein